MDDKTLSPIEFATSLRASLGKGEIDTTANGIHITGFGSRYIYVIDNSNHYVVGIESIRGFTRCPKTEEGVGYASSYILKHESEGWFKPRKEPSLEGLSPVEFKKRRE